jgi:hypothetical protein
MKVERDLMTVANSVFEKVEMKAVERGVMRVHSKVWMDLTSVD